MAKKKKDISGYTEPQGFTHGMISDVDPHFQLKGSYSDAQNIRLTNSEGDTFTVENIEGNSLFVDLANFSISVNAGQGGSSDVSDYGTFYDRGPDNSASNNFEMSNRCSIVGHVSYANQLLLMIVGRFEYDRGSDGSSSTPFASQKDRTIFLLVDFNENLTVNKVSDLRVCYNAPGAGSWQYPDLNMELDSPVRIEHIIENGCISRIYWTDNKNPLRTLNINQERLDLLSIESLDITPLMSPSQPVLNSTISGSLPVGVYQYTYKYISENGGETSFSPLSNLYHVSDKAFGSSVTYGGGPKGNVGTQGFNIDIHDIDNKFDYVELYALFYEDLNNPPRVAVVNRSVITNSLTVSFTHVGWNNELENGLEEVLIATNTWDVCKDIAIKDNILFAANLKQKRNWISEEEWNVKVLRHALLPVSSPPAGQFALNAMLTTNDPNVKHYDGNGEIAEGTADDNGSICGHGQLLGAAGTIYDSSTHTYLEYDGNLNNPMWTTCYAPKQEDGRAKTKFVFRYLSDKKTLGAESFNYGTNTLGGCRITFGISQREADQTQNTNTAPFISATSMDPQALTLEESPMATDNIYDEGSGALDTNTNTVFQTSMSLGGTKDPHAAGDRRGYQRGEVYRFGVQVYDLNGSAGNVLWIGDIQTPEQYDPLRMLLTQSVNYSPEKTVSELISDSLFASHQKCQDHRLSYVYGHVVPPCEVEWFTPRKAVGQNSHSDSGAYVNRNGDVIDIDVKPGSNGGYKGTSNSGRVKGLAFGPYGTYQSGTSYIKYKNNTATDPFDLYDASVEKNDTHYLFDLFIHFEFAIPEAVCKKISGFRVVRAERKEEDRRVSQQGLLNQTAQYGDATEHLSYGYDDTNFSAADNKGFDDDPVFVNQLAGDGEDPTPVEQPEYNTYLNGYLGLAENSFSAWMQQDFTKQDGKTTVGGNTEERVYYHPETEDSKQWGAHKQMYAVPNHRNPAAWFGPGTSCKDQGLARHCNYFGGLNHHSYKYNNQNGDEMINRGRNAGNAHVSGSVFTLDSPDSAFGVRPYSFKSGDMLRIDCVLKLTDSERFITADSSLSDIPVNGFHGHNLRVGQDSSLNPGYLSGGPHEGTYGFGLYTGGTDDARELTNFPYAKDKTIQESLRFASRYDINENYGILIGKYYCWDTGYGIQLEMNNGATYGDNNGNSHLGNRPATSNGFMLPISNAKELSDGEIVPSGFFKNSRKVKKGRALGFSNNTLGYVKTRNTNEKACYIFGAVDKKISRYNGEDAGSIYGSDGTLDWDEEKQAKDFNYDTVSTLQMGLRSILIEVNNEIKNVRKFGPGDGDSRFTVDWSQASAVNFLHDSWFAPENLSVIATMGNWNGYENDGQSVHYGDRSGYPTNEAVVASHNQQNYTNGSKGDTNGFVPGEGINRTGCAATWNRGYHPHKYLCSIIRKVTPYGGHNKSAIESTRYISCGNFHPVKQDVDGMQWHTSKVFGGDTFINLYSHQKTSTPYMKKSMARWQVFPVESYVNTDMRSGLTLNNGDAEIGKEMNKAPYSNDWLYNSVYSQENTIKSGLMIDESQSCENLELPYEIAYSNTKVSGEPGDSFRNFPINQFHDMEGLYGEINRIINFKNEIYVLQDSAFAKLLVNPLSMLSDDTGTSLFTGTGETVENHIYISTKYGSRHRSSVTMSEKSLYFVDTNFARLFKYDTEQLTSLGDALGQRNYLKYIIKDWENVAKKICSKSHPAPPWDVSGDQLHSPLRGKLDSLKKTPNSRNYFADNPLKFLGITSIFDHKNKELLVTFHNSAWKDLDDKRLTFADPMDNHSMGNPADGQPIKISQTLVYNESVNAFTSKYSVAPPQWLTGGQGSFILCPENEIDVTSISYRSGDLNDEPYEIYGSSQGGLHGLNGRWYINYRPNPLRLWLWDHHEEGKKTNFFGKKDDTLEVDDTGLGPDVESPIDGNDYMSMSTVELAGTKYVADESYIEKVINDDAGNKKTFDNVRIIMTPSDTPFENELGYSVVDFRTEVTDYQHLVIKNRFEFQDGTDGWVFWDGTQNINAQIFSPAIITGCTDDAAVNYNPNANSDDGSCIAALDGCTDPAMFNYNPNANNDDGSCIAYVYGCTDINAFNYDANANTDDNSCCYASGCTDPTACNYDSNACYDDGSCLHNFGCTDPTAANYDNAADCDDGSCCYISGCTDPTACNYDSNACHDDGNCTYAAANADCNGNCLGGYVDVNGTCVSEVLGCTDPGASNYNPSANLDNGSCIPCVYGCTDPTAFNYNPNANCNDPNNPCQAIVNGCTDPAATNYNSNANTDDGSCCYTGTNGCTDPNACNYDANALCDDGSCTYPIANADCNGCLPSFTDVNGSCVPTMLGCTDPTADNYNPAANTDDGSCTYGSVLGCTDSNACNYDPLATTDDGSCLTPDGCTDPAYVEYDPNAQCDDGSCTTLCVDGCTDSAFTEYNPSATCDDGSCSTAVVLGCTDPTQFNYDPNANTDDGSCVPIVNGCTDPTADNYDSAANTDDGSCTYTSTPGVTAFCNPTGYSQAVGCYYCYNSHNISSNNPNRNQGSKYDAVSIIANSSNIGVTWTYNGINYSATAEIDMWKDLNTGLTVYPSSANGHSVADYINGTGSVYNGNPHPAPNFAVRRFYVRDVGRSGQTNCQTCAYQEGTDFEASTKFYLDAPTNPYNL